MGAQAEQEVQRWLTCYLQARMLDEMNGKSCEVVTGAVIGRVASIAAGEECD